MSKLTPQQQAALNEILKKFADRLLPAKLKNTNRNGLLLADYNVSRGLPINADTMYDAAKEIYRELEWEIKPAKLLREERATKPDKVESIQQVENDSEKKRRAGEAADAFAKQQAEFEASAMTLVDSFLPMNKRGSIDYRKMGDVQTQLREHIKKEKQRGVRMKDVHAIVVAEIQRQYSLIEKAGERL